MFRFLITLLIINSYSGSWGAPTNNVTVSLSLSLNDLANRCKSPFLSTQMKNKLIDCQVPVPPYQKKQLECLLFYDINRQLCEAFASSKLPLEDNTSKLLAVQDVSELCTTTKDWKFTYFNEVYNHTVNAVFRDPAKCFKFCILESENILSVDSTFYCKYFNWGSNMLKPQLSIPNAEDNADIVVHGSNKNIPIKKYSEKSSKADIATEKGDLSNKDSPNTVKITQSNILSPKSEPITSTNNVNSEIVATPNKVEQNTVNVQQNKLQDVTDINKEPNVSIPQVNTGTLVNGIKPPVDARVLALKEKTTSTVSSIESKNKKIETGKDGTNQDVVNQIENRPAIDNADPDDYPPNDNDSEEVRDGLGDTHGDDDPEDPLDTKIEEIVNKKETKLNEQITIDNNDLLPKDSFSNTIPDFAEEDDHFFPFFLTAIIMIVLLYILYHNKNRVSKVVLGLIVEGRQPGRRRNSRGHAYRRLDTLEQAMSTNTAAPPSKIIY